MRHGHASIEDFTLMFKAQISFVVEDGAREHGKEGTENQRGRRIKSGISGTDGQERMKD
jgi:hypothetical protein